MKITIELDTENEKDEDVLDILLREMSCIKKFDIQSDENLFKGE